MSRFDAIKASAVVQIPLEKWREVEGLVAGAAEERRALIDDIEAALDELASEQCEHCKAAAARPKHGFRRATGYPTIAHHPHGDNGAYGEVFEHVLARPEKPGDKHPVIECTASGVQKVISKLGRTKRTSCP